MADGDLYVAVVAPTVITKPTVGTAAVSPATGHASKPTTGQAQPRPRGAATP